MDPGQVESIRAIVAEGRDELTRAAALPPEMARTRFATGPPEKRAQLIESEEYQTAVEAARAAALKTRAGITQRIAKVLTKKQRENYQHMVGEPFGLEKLRDPRKTDGGESKGRVGSGATQGSKTPAPKKAR
jgi:hypothetical protein